LDERFRESLHKSFKASQGSQREICDFHFAHKINDLKSMILAAHLTYMDVGNAEFCQEQNRSCAGGTSELIRGSLG
jgi:hypothetical protein